MVKGDMVKGDVVKGDVVRGEREVVYVFDGLKQQVNRLDIRDKDFMIAEIGKGYADWLPGKNKDQENISGAGSDSFNALVLYDNDMQPYRQIYYSEDYIPTIERLNSELND